jgi:hypothetical protein
MHGIPRQRIHARTLSRNPLASTAGACPRFPEDDARNGSRCGPAVSSMAGLHQAQEIDMQAIRNTRRPALRASPLVAAALVALAGAAQASSHREAPFIATQPKVDATDFYMFNSYESGRSDYVTIIANYEPLQDAYGGPNYFALDPHALYEIHIDNNGDGVEDITYQFRFSSKLINKGQGITVPVGDQMPEIAPLQDGTVTMPHDQHLQYNETYTISLVKGDRTSGAPTAVTNAANGAAVFDKPVDNIGEKTIPDYVGYAAQHVYNVDFPGCSKAGRVFVGQRQDPFAVNLGVIFDQVDAPLSVITNPNDYGLTPNILSDKNVTTIALEVAKSCLTQGSEPVIGGWTTASLRQEHMLDPSPKAGLETTDRTGGAWVQVSRLGMPLVNELVIGLKDKDHFNGSKPIDDAQFLNYVTHPSYPKLLESYLNLPGSSPTNIPRNDLVVTFLEGIGGVNQPHNVVPSEMLRLNTAIPAVPYAQQNRLGIVGNILAKGNDNAGFPNGRRPKDDVVDIALIVVEGGLCMANGNNNALGFGSACNPSAVPLGATAFDLNDTVDQAASTFLASFPYLNTPNSGTGAESESASRARDGSKR